MDYVCGLCVWIMYVDYVHGLCVWTMCVDYVCGLCVWIMCVDYVRGLYMWLAHHLLVVVRVPGFKPFHIASSYMIYIYIGVLY